MSRKQLLITVLTIVCVLLILIAAYYVTINIPKDAGKNPSSNEIDENPSSTNSPEETSPESLVDSPESAQGSPSSSPSPSLNDSQNEILQDTTFVVPESPFGTIGIITAIATALGIFAIKQRKKASK